MHPERAARNLARIGSIFIIAVFALRLASLVMIFRQTSLSSAAASFIPAIPAVGHYIVLPDGKQVIFEQQAGAGEKNGWFHVALEGGPVTPIDPPVTDLRFFKVSSGQLLWQSGNRFVPVKELPPGTQVPIYALSPDGKNLAFAAYKPGQAWSLYVISSLGQVDWLGDQSSIAGISWSPDGLNLAFVAPVNGTDQVLRIDRMGQDQRQLTFNASRKSSPLWSPDGRVIAFISSSGKGPLSLGAVTPTPEALYEPTLTPYQAANLISIEVIDANVDRTGGSPRLLVEDGRQKYDLAWGVTSAGARLVYAARLPDHPQTAYLYLLDPQSGQSRRVYPFLEMTALGCPATIPGGETRTIRITIANHGLQQASVPVVLRAAAQRFPNDDKPDTHVVRSETVQVPAGADRTLEWQVAAAPGLATHIAALINPTDSSPVIERRCDAVNTYHGLPNLPFLPFVLPLTAAGMLLYIPWMSQQKKRRLWALYLTLPLVIVLIIAFEVRIARIV